jgi:transcriptional antiterminator RfaH
MSKSEGLAQSRGTILKANLTGRYLAMQHWYALHTKAYAERRAASELHRHGIETYVPEVSHKADKQPDKRIAFFPGYLFMNVDLNATNAARWRWASGVRHIVSHGETPVVIPNEIIGFIRRQLAEREAAAALAKPQRFKKGDSVRIADGPFGDMLAVFEGPVSASERVTVLMDFLGRLSRVRVDLDSLEPANSPGDQNLKAKRRRRTRGRGRPIRYAD